MSGTQVGEAQDVVDLAESVNDTYLCLMAEQMADDLRRGNVRNPEKMRAFISESWLLGAAVENASVQLERKAKQWDQLQRKEDAEKKRIEEKQKKKEENRAKRQAEAELKGENAEKEGRTQVAWMNRDQRDAALNKSLMEKMKNGKKAVLTREEARYYEKTRGRKCPYTVAR